jgi:hypothetical protein
MKYMDKHDLSLTMAGHPFVVSEDLLAQAAVGCLDASQTALVPLLQGGGGALFLATDVAEVVCHHVPVFPGCFLCQWTEDDGSDACLALVVRIILLREEESGGQGDLWVVLSQMPGIPASRDICVSADKWQRYAADDSQRVTAYVRFQDMSFCILHQHTVDGAYLFLPEP